MLIIVLTLALNLAQLPQPVPIPAELENANIEVVLHATQNHFAAENRSAGLHLLFFGSEELGTFAVLRLGPGQRMVHAFPRGSIDDVLVEVVAVSDRAWRNTGALRMPELRNSAQGTLWIQGAADRSVAWGQRPGGIQHLAAQAELLAAETLAAHPGLRDHSSSLAAHVPVPLPTQDKKGSRPPVLDKKPLPPV